MRRAVLKSLGQNFLKSPALAGKIVEASGVEPQDTVLEIGPGKGALTRELAKVASRVVAVEKDKGLAADLQLSLPENVEMYHSDILKSDLGSFGLSNQGYKVVSNLPFNVGSAILRFLLENSVRPSCLRVILQKEVVDRIVCKDGKHSILSLSVNFFGEPRLLMPISKKQYHPQPKVDTALLAVDCFDSLIIPENEIGSFFTLIKSGFSSKRKKLSNNLVKRGGYSKDLVFKSLEKVKIPVDFRAEQLDLSDWVSLFRELTR